jgi:hypothetical protein
MLKTIARFVRRTDSGQEARFPAASVQHYLMDAPAAPRGRVSARTNSQERISMMATTHAAQEKLRGPSDPTLGENAACT